MTRRILIIDPASGAAGDMFLGALVDLGADFGALQAALAALPVGGFEVRRESVVRAGVRATKIRVALDALQGGEEQPGFHAHEHEHGHGRHLGEILDLILRSSMPERAKALSIKAFGMLGEAEAKAHDCPLEAVHFHEVGATDAIVDICGTALLVSALDVPEVYCRPVSVGAGTVRCSHGVVPVPAPATRHLIGGFPLREPAAQRELLTPTGAALLRALEPRYDIPPARMIAEGLGAGTLDFVTHPNVLRIQLCELS